MELLEYDYDYVMHYYDIYCDLVEYFNFEDFNDYLSYLEENGEFYE